MKITHYMASFRLEDGGVVRAVLDICGVLARRGHEVRIVTGDAQDVPAEWRDGADLCPRVVQVAPSGSNGGFLGTESVREIESLVIDADAVHLHTPWDRANRQLARLALRYSTPYFLTVHGMLDDWSMQQKAAKKRLYLALGGRRLLERAAGVHCTAQGELEQAGRWFPRGRGVVIPYVFDLEPFRELPNPKLAESIEQVRTNDPIVLFLSRLHHKKQPEVLIDAARILKDQGRSCRILFAGTGATRYEEALRHRVEQCDVADYVFFLGLVVGAEKLALYQRADVFALPTSQENFGFVYTESLAAGTPVVATKGTDIWRELEQSGGAVIADGTPEATAAAIADLLDDPDRVTRMGELGRSWVFEALDSDRIAEQFEKMYSDVIG